MRWRSLVFVFVHVLASGACAPGAEAHVIGENSPRDSLAVHSGPSTATTGAGGASVHHQDAGMVPAQTRDEDAGVPVRS
jgi:hypothetical protein